MRLVAHSLGRIVKPGQPDARGHELRLELANAFPASLQFGVDIHTALLLC